MDQVFKFYLKKDDNTYYVLSGGRVIETTEKTPLKYALDGWDDIELSYVRNEDYYGIVRDITSSLRFVLDGAKILKHIYFTEGWTASPVLHVEKLRTLDFKYLPFYVTRLPLDMAQIGEDYFDVPMANDGQVDEIFNRKGTPYKIPLEGADLKVLSIDGFTIDNVVSYTPITFISGSVGVCSLIQTNRLSDLGGRYMPESVESTTDFQTPQYPGNPFFIAPFDQTITVRIKNMKILGTYQPYVIILRYDKNQNPYPPEWQYMVDAPSVPNVINDVIEIDVIEGDTLIFAGGASLTFGQSPPPIFEIHDKSDTEYASFEVSGSVSFAATSALAFRYIDFASKVVDKVSNGKYTVKSDFLSNPDTSNAFRAANYDNSPYNTMVTSGEALRGITGATINTSFEDMAKDLWMRWMCGIGLENGNIIRIEPVGYFLNRDIEIFHIDGRDVATLTIKPHSEAVFNSLIIGYGDYTYGQLGGREEFNTGQTYLLTAVNRIGQRTKDIRTPYRADIYGIEKLRNYYNSDSTGITETATIDTQGDNDTFLIEADPTPEYTFNGVDYYIPYRPVPISISGVTNPETMYNLTLSPKRALLRHLPFIKGLSNSGKLQFQTTDKNPGLECELFAGNIIENADINLADNGIEPLYQWEVLEVTASPPDNLMSILNIPVNGYISFDYKGHVFKGFILDVGCTPATRDKYTFKLLSHPDNDLSKLINPV